MKFKRVLIAVDTGLEADEVAQMGFHLARNLNAEAALVSVIEEYVPIAGEPEVSAVSGIDVEKIRKEEAVKILDQLAVKFGNGAKVEQFTPEGDPQKEIIEAADKWAADLIVTGTHGRKGLGHLILGSVAEYVVRNSIVPVMVIPFKKEE